MEQKEREVGTGLRKNESLFHVAFYSYYTQIEHTIWVISLYCPLYWVILCHIP